MDVGDASLLHAFTMSLVWDCFREMKELGSVPAPACLRCQGCRDCMFRRRRLNKEEQAVVSWLGSEMEIDPETEIISVQYPWKPCVSRMVDNSGQALQVQASMEHHMLHLGSLPDFVKEMEKAIEEGKVRKLTQDEIDAWHVPTHYVMVFPVIKTESVSTKTIIVSNSAMRNARARLSLNECMYALVPIRCVS